MTQGHLEYFGRRVKFWIDGIHKRTTTRRRYPQGDRGRIRVSLIAENRG
jgi:hypothetical protein